ncbi:MAG: hypothetical protein AAF328_03550 [Planctomycetota bacterium]
MRTSHPFTTHARSHTGLRPWLVTALTLLALLGLTRPASADAPEIYGVQTGDRLTGPAILWAEARGPSHWMTLHLRGPATNLEARGTNRRVHLRETPSTGAPLPWDASQARPGNYTLTATSYFRGRSWDRHTVNFTVGEPAPSETATQANDEETVTTQSASQPQPQAQAAQLADALPAARFVNAPASFIAQAGGRIPFELTGPLPNGADVLALAWDHDRRTMVDNFAHVIKQPPYNLDINRVVRLPEGNFELQLHVRGNDGEFIQTDTHDFEMTPATASGEAGATALPQVSFPNQSRTFTRGSGRALQVDVEGDVPNDADLLVIAWSLGQGELVERFAHALTGPNFQIPASRLNRLPAGANEIQVLVRRNGQVQRKVALTIAVSEPAAPVTGTDNGTNPDNTGNPDPVVDTPSDPLTDPDSPPVTNPDDNAEEPEPQPVVAQPTPGLDLNLAFAAGVPDQYTRGSDATLRVSIGGRLPDTADILLLAWSYDQNAMVGSFAHTLREGDRTLKNGQLDKLPAGRVELQAHLRLATGTVQVAKQDITIVIPQAEEPTPVLAPLPDIAAGPGFTSFPLKSGGRAIYVSSSQGSDSNTGLSPNAPLKSPKEGIKKLRDGYPDQLLLKAGDTFRGGLGQWTKSGRDANNKMVVGVYGDGPRPKFYSDGENLITCTNSVDHVAFVGLHGYANRRDPNGPDYRGDHGSTQEIAIVWYGKSEDLHFEDMKLEWYTGAMVLQNSPGNIRNVRLHRMIVTNSWKHHKDGHSAGMYFQGAEDVVITDSLFDHNGWRPGRDKERTKFNHNLYFQKDTKRITVSRTILTRGSHNAVQFRGGGILEDSLLAYNPYGAFVAQEGGIMRRNVVLHGNDMLNSYPLGLGLQVLPSSYAVVEDNVIAHKVGTAGWVGAIEISYRNDIIDPPSNFKVVVRRNRVVNYPREYRRESIYKTTDGVDLTLSSNVMDYASGGKSDPPFVDPTRDLDAYARTLGLGDMDGFLAKAASRERGQWEDRYAAVGANAWIRAGYEYLPYD